ncbi:MULTISPECIES: hypothetical protein [Streptomyces]|uniref:Uncharacterized protein n=1 Tax=Streptomyces edwardsiae TaxID=3075527 RepID=A0ABU2QPM1_9ACTN|nr:MULTISPECIES: hypothetical protein [unclassified Streptomyces]MDT0394181.1 hypothetical protein [Streptomyces sp. DSM 41636]MDT0405799.1 hypothetical protein [Streptomyces sp. DSM 41635]
MTDETGLKEHLTDLAASGVRLTTPLTAERVRARGEQRLRRKRAAVTGGGVLLVAVLAVGGLALTRTPRASDPPAVLPAPTASAFVPPTPAPGEEYGSELGLVYGAMAEGDTVRVTVEQRGTGVVHTLILPRGTLVEVRQLAGGSPADVQLGDLVDRLAGGPRWMFAIDYDGEGRVQSLREAYWLGG